MSVFYPLVRPEQVEAADRELAIALHLAGNDVDLNALTTRDRDEIAAARRPSQDGETRPVIGIVWILAVAGYVSALFAPMPPTVVPAVALVLIAILWWTGAAGGRDVVTALGWVMITASLDPAVPMLMRASGAFSG